MPGKIYAILEAPGSYHNEEERWRGLLPSLFLFRFVAPPFQPEMVGSYLIRSVWFLNHLLLEGTGRIQNFGS
jgi:hypothetical protein